jgi:hypothetical protein
MNLGMDQAQLQRVHKCYTEAKKHGLYKAGKASMTLDIWTACHVVCVSNAAREPVLL